MNDILLSPIRLDEMESLVQKSVKKALDQYGIGKLNTEPEDEPLMTIHEAANLLRIAVPTMYSYVSRREIPFIKKRQRLYFDRKQLQEWLRSGQQRTSAEIKADAMASLEAQGE